MGNIADLWRRFWSLSLWVKGAIVGGWALATVLAVVAVLALTRDGADRQQDVAGASREPTAAHLQVTPTPTTASLLAELSLTPAPDRANCDEIRGTQYRSATERVWFLANCITPTSTRAVPFLDNEPRTTEPSAQSQPQATLPPPGPSLQPGEAVAVAMDWIVEQGGTRHGSIIADTGHVLSPLLPLQVYSDTCSASYSQGAWEIQCDARFGYPCELSCATVVQLCVYETTLTVSVC